MLRLPLNSYQWSPDNSFFLTEKQRKMRRENAVLWGLIYNRCVRTKRGWKLRTWLFTPRLWSIKNQLDGKMCAALSKLWPMRTHGLEEKENWRHRRCGGELKSDRRIAEWEERLCFIIALHQFNFNPYHALNPNQNNLSPLRYFSVITPEISP